MKKNIDHIEEYRITQYSLSRLTKGLNLPMARMFITSPDFGNTGSFILPIKLGSGVKAFVHSHNKAEGWEYVSVRIIGEDRFPTWEEMNYIKGLFWNETETVFLFMPATNRKMKRSNFSLYMWKPESVEIPLPDRIIV